MTRNEYNGWANYETWCVNLWIDDDADSQTQWRNRAQAAYDAADAPSANARLTGREPFTRDEKAVLALEKQLKAHFESESPLDDANVWADLLNAALSEVNWHEIAQGIVEGVSKETIEA